MGKRGRRRRKGRAKTAPFDGLPRVQREGTIAPGDLDEASAPRRVDGVVQVEIDAEQVLIGGAWGGAQVLNPTGALVWQFLDGEVTLGELVDDFSEATSVPRTVVREDVLGFARSLGDAGLLVDVEYPTIDFDDAAGPPTVAFEDGVMLDDFTARDLDGGERSLADFRGRRVYLVNWNPGCGFCDSIAETLAALEGDLAREGIDLVLVAAGDADANRALVERSGLHASVLLTPEGVDPFGGLGTPAALLLDVEGRVSGELATGASKVPERAAALAGVDLSERLGTDGDDGVRYLPSTGGMCGPGAASGPKTSWAGTSAFAFGDVRVGIRYNSQATADLLEKLLVGAHVDDAGVGDNYSVALTHPGSAANDLELLVLGTRQIVRSRSKRRVLTGLLRYLSSDVFDADPSLLRVNATAAVDDGGQGLVLPPGLTGWLGKLQPRLAKLGITLVDMPFVSLDVGTGELVVPPPAVEHDETVLHDSDAGVTLGRTELPMVESGRYPLAAWYIHAADPYGASDRRDEAPPRPALAVASTIGLCPTDDLEATAARLASLVDRVPVRGVHYTSANELTEALRAR